MATRGVYAGQVRRRGRGGWGRLIVVLLAVVVALMAATALFAPWAYYLGGHFHWAPMWAGVADFAGPDGEYQLFLWMRPFPQGTALHLDTALTGNATLCTPQGERIFMKVSGGMDRHLPTDTVGQRIGLSAYERNAVYRFWDSVNKPGGARLALKGVWAEGRIDATGTVTRAKGLAPMNFSGALKETELWRAPGCPR